MTEGTPAEGGNEPEETLDDGNEPQGEPSQSQSEILISRLKRLGARPQVLWVFAVVVLAIAAWLEIKQTDVVPPLLVVLALLLIGLATPQAMNYLDNLEQFSAGGVTLTFRDGAAKSVELRIPTGPRLSGDRELDDDAEGRFVDPNPSDARSEALVLKGKLKQRLDWIQRELDLPGMPGSSSTERVERLKWLEFLLPDEAELMQSLAELTPTSVERAHSRDPLALYDFVKASDLLVWRLRSIVFDRQVRQVFRDGELKKTWRLFDWDPQPRGRWTPWFIAHAPARSKSTEPTTLLIAARAIPSAKGLENVVANLSKKRVSIPNADEMPGFVVLRDRSKRLKEDRDYSNGPRAQVIALEGLRDIARTRELPSDEENE